MRGIAAATFLLCAASPAAAGSPALQPELAGLSFLVGHWSGGKGTVADTGGSATGTSSFTIEANGVVLLRRDHTELSDAKGVPAGAFDQIMMIYADAGQIHADYVGGGHLIHYVSAIVQPGRSVTFASAPHSGAPVFTLAYERQASRTVAVTFSIKPPGSPTSHPIATGVLKQTQ
jgi:hypothetical protein